MKKVLLVSLLILTLVLLCACVEKLESDTTPGIGPIETETAPDAQDPMLGLDKDKIPDADSSKNPGTSTEPTEPVSGDDPSEPKPSEDPTEPGSTDPSDPTESTEPGSNEDPTEPSETDKPLTDITITNGVGADGKAVTTALSKYFKNAEASAEGKVVKKSTSGNKTIYRVQYDDSMTFIVEVTPIGSNLQVEVYLEHYRLIMGKDKAVKVTVGDYTGSALTGEVNWDDQKAAKTLLAKALAPKGDGNSVKIDVEMFFGGTYGGVKIDMMSLSETFNLK